GLSGLPSGTLDIPASSPFAVSPDDESLFRYFTQFDPLRRTVKSNTFQGGAALNGNLPGWQWSLTGDYAREQVDTTTQHSSDLGLLQAAIDNDTAGPCASDFGPLLLRPVTARARSTSTAINSLATISGTLLYLPSV